jgi:hypothetical protein
MKAAYDNRVLTVVRKFTACNQGLMQPLNKMFMCLL